MDSSSTIVATLTNDDGTLYRIVEVGSCTSVIREPVPRTLLARAFDLDPDDLTFDVIEWEPMVTIPIPILPIAPVPKFQLVGLWRRRPPSRCW